MRVAFLGPAGTFSHAVLLASARPEAHDAEPLACATERDALLAVRDGAADAALVPVENAIEGGVNATVDTLVRDGAQLRVVGEELLPISQALIARPGITTREVTVVRSHPQGLAQCRGSLARLIPHARLEAVASTADAVRSLTETTAPVAAIGAAAAARVYGCAVLAKGIEDEPGNVTRFWWVRRADECDAAELEARPPAGWKTTIAFAGDGDGEPGWLVLCLQAFGDGGLNLTRIESRPSRERFGHYVFLVDAGGRAGEPAIDGAIAALRDRCSRVTVLGSYPAATADG